MIQWMGMDMEKKMQGINYVFPEEESVKNSRPIVVPVMGCIG